MNVFVVSDIHGMYKQFEKILSFWDQESTLVILGDMIDRGPQSYEVVRKVMELKEQFGERVVYCKGNHEDMFLSFMEHPEVERSIYFNNGGRKTIQSFLQQTSVDREELGLLEQVYIIEEHFKEEVAFLATGQFYALIGNLAFTHAGFESENADITATIDDDFLWIRDHYLQDNHTPYINIFGHTPTCFIHKSHDIWISEDKKYIGIDGGCFLGGQLNALSISEDGEILQTFSVGNGRENDKN